MKKTTVSRRQLFTGFSAKHLAGKQKEGKNQTHLFPTSAVQLERAKKMWQAKEELHQQLWDTLEGPAVELTVRANGKSVSVMLDFDVWHSALEPIMEHVGGQLSSLEQQVLRHASEVESGINECGLDGSEEQWAVSKFLHSVPTSASSPAERCPLLPEADMAA